MSRRGRRSAAGGRTRGRRRRGRRPGGRGAAAVARLAASVLGMAGVLTLGVYLAVGDRGEVETLRNPEVWSGSRVRVEVFNGGGVTGMAREATGVLREAGFDVVTFGNADAFDPERPSEVVDRVGRADAALAVAAALGVANVRSDPDPNLFVDVTVVVGRDWSGSGAAGTREGGRREPPWWDPSEWLGAEDSADLMEDAPSGGRPSEPRRPE